RREWAGPTLASGAPRSRPRRRTRASAAVASAGGAARGRGPPARHPPGLLLLAFSFVGQVQGELLQTRVDGYDLWAAHLAVPRLRVSAFAGRDAVQVVAAHG